MKSITQNLLTMALLTVTLLPSCKKTQDNPSSPTEVSNVDKSGVTLFSAFRSTPQAFTVAAGVDTKIKGAQGTILEFYPNSFKDKNGNIISSGAIKIELTEMYTPGDMLANRTSTATTDGVLTSGGEVNIKASRNGEEVFANKYKLGFKAAAAAPTKPMELYTGDANNPDSITFWNVTKIAPKAGTDYITDTTTTWDLTEEAYYLFDSCTSFNMINCDHPYDATSKNLTISVVFPDNTFKSTMCSLTLIYPSLNVVTMITGYQYNSASHTMTFRGWIPTGVLGKFVLLIPKDASKSYYYETQGSVMGDMSINANVALLSVTQVQSKLKAL